jgi:hypothetical protein
VCEEPGSAQLSKNEDDQLIIENTKNEI